MARSNTIAQVNDVTRISAGTEIQGALGSNSDIRIDGVFEGDLVTSGKLVLGEKAVIKGNVMCNSADIWGTIEGTFTVGDIECENGMLTLLPHVHQTDGFFMAKIRRKI